MATDVTLRVAALWRYPVKTLAGEPLSGWMIGRDGIPGGRIVCVRGREGVRTSRRHFRLLGLRGDDAWLDACDGPERFGVLPLLVATDGAVAAFGRDVRRLRPANQTLCARWRSGLDAYGKRYVTSFADYGIGNLMTTAVMPTVFRQDPRYFVLGKGSVLHRAGYALSRTLVTRTRSGQRHFNQSEIFGNIVGAEVSNVYHPAEDRRFSVTMSRWETQVLWDSLTNELKEFWPDIRRHLHRS